MTDIYKKIWEKNHNLKKEKKGYLKKFVNIFKGGIEVVRKYNHKRSVSQEFLKIEIERVKKRISIFL